MLARVTASKGWRGLAAGLLPRLLWVSLGGVIFFGVYEHKSTRSPASLGAGARTADQLE